MRSPQGTHSYSRYLKHHHKLISSCKIVNEIALVISLSYPKFILFLTCKRFNQGNHQYTLIILLMQSSKHRENAMHKGRTRPSQQKGKITKEKKMKESVIPEQCHMLTAEDDLHQHVLEH